MNHKLFNILVSESDKISQVLAKMAEMKNDPAIPPGIALVVDKTKKLLGIVTNGDIRRAFAAGIKVGEPVSLVMNKKPSVVEHSGDATSILTSVFNQIKEGRWPKDRLEKILVVDKNRRVLDLVSFYDLVQKSDIRFKHIGIVGLGYVGLTLGLTLADLGFVVKAYDANTEVMKAIGAGKPHFYEAGLERLLKDHLHKKFKLVANFKNANNCDVYFVAVGTPLDRENKPHLGYLERAAENLGKVLKLGDAVVLRSTVPLGTTREVVLPILEKVSGLKGGEDFMVAFAPERTIEGKALEELRKLPQVIGGINLASRDLVASIFNFLSNSTILVDSLEAAEMVKLINNTYRDVTFGFANEIALVAARWGINTKKVIEAANYGYARANVPLPSPGVGGYCLEKDPFIFIESARAKGYEPRFPAHARQVSGAMVDFVAGSVMDFLRARKKDIRKAKIFVLGFAFKGRPVTSDTRGSTTISLIRKLQQAQAANIYGFDPAVVKDEIVRHKVKYVASPEKGFEGADAIVIMNNHPDFENLNARSFLDKSQKPVLFFDTWSLHDPEEIGKVTGVHYRSL